MKKPLYAVLIAFALLSSPVVAMTGPNDEHQDANDRLIITVGDSGAIQQIERIANNYGSKIKYLTELDVILLQGWDNTLKESLERVDGILSIEREAKAYLQFTPDDPYYSLNQWGLTKINADEAWDFTLGSSDVIVAILDTGIDYTHDDLTANMWRDASNHYGYDFINDDNDPMDDNINGYEGGVWHPNLYIYHGTHVAGITGAVTDNSLGIAGVAQVKLMAVKVMNDSGEGTDATVAEGIVYAVDNGADIITMSLGVDSSTLILGNAVNYAKSHEVVLVAAAGNDGTSHVSYPAAYPYVISVGATDQLDRRASFSNYGTNLDLMAPGSRIWSTRVGDTYQELSGTSTAAPFVAGVAALMLSVNPALTPVEVGSIMNQTATNLGTAGWDSTTGWGIVDARDAIISIAGPAATITDYPEAVSPNSTVSISWIVSGAGNLTIDSTYLRWGYSLGSMTHISGMYYGNTTPHSFTASDVVAPPEEGDTLYLQAVASIDGVEYLSTVVRINASHSASDPITQLINSIRDFIENDLGLLNFALIIVFIAVVVVIAMVMRAGRRSRRASTSNVPAYYESTPAPIQHIPTTPVYQPEKDISEAKIDISGGMLNPPVIEISEGTRVIWRNRDWAPPPGISIVSGKVDSQGPHPDGIFSSGLMVAPGEYWSVIFNSPGVYSYYIGNLNLNGKIIVRSRG